MAIRFRAVTGILYHAKTGDPLISATLKFELSKGFGLTDTHLITDAPVTTTTGADGSFSINLWCDEDALVPIDYAVTLPKESSGLPIDKPEYKGVFSLVYDIAPIALSILLTSSVPSPLANALLYAIIDARIIAVGGTGGTVDGTIIDASIRAVSGNAVFDALALKADKNAVVNLTAAQTIAGVKTFTLPPLVPIDAYNFLPWTTDYAAETPSKQSVANQFEDIKGAFGAKADKVGGLVPENQLPDFILKFLTVAAFPATGDVRKIYIVTTGADINKVYRWGGAVYVQLAPAAASGGGGAGGFTTATKATAYAILIGDNYTNFNNTGATALVSLNLPAAATDLNYSFTVTDADGMQINFTNGATGYSGATAATFYLRSVVKGSTMVIRGQGAEWYITNLTGTWTIA